MQKKFKLFTPIILLLMAVIILLTLLTLFYDRWLFIFFSIISALSFFFVYILLIRVNKRLGKVIDDLGQSIYFANHKAYVSSNIPTLVVFNGEEIIWHNTTFLENVVNNKSILGEHINQIFPDINVLEPTDHKGIALSFADRQYTVFITLEWQDEQKISVLHFIDDTSLKSDSLEFHQSRPYVAVLSVDNYQELQEYKEIERARVMSSIEEAIRDYFGKSYGFLQKIKQNKFIIIIEERGVQKIKSDKFEILSTVRNMQFSDSALNSTLSIGIGYDASTLSESENMANQALEMCLGRGGDQAAIKVKNGYEFYGGVSSGVEKRTKVKTRIIASALSELIENSSNVIIMGHRFSDLDAVGAAVGMLKAVREVRLNSFICIDQNKTLATPMIEKLKLNGYTNDDFRPPEVALKSVNNNTLLIVVDAHVPGVLESEALYKSCRSVVIIDHHRKLVDFITNAVIFYHEPYASSASEMVTELVQYLHVEPNIGKVEAEALLSGITLDTKNFVMRTGARTFEAAAWLRRMGADTVEVRKTFASSMENYLSKAGIVSRAESYKHCAIAYSAEQFEGIRIVSSQAADDLMNISGTIGSFVVFPYDNMINVSARSMGAINVQVVMESLGGGGHNTMAAAQFENETVENVIARVKVAIDGYYASLPEDRIKELNISSLIAEETDDIPDEGTILEGQSLDLQGKQ